MNKLSDTQLIEWSNRKSPRLDELTNTSVTTYLQSVYKIMFNQEIVITTPKESISVINKINKHI